jgi:outer membrane immunogenic protein
MSKKYQFLATSLMAFTLTTLAATAHAQTDTDTNWTGLYAGADIGGGFGTSRKDITSTGRSSGDFGVDGAIGGATLGYNLQRGPLVMGLESDISGSSVTGSHGCATPGFTCETSNTWLATLRPRLGFAFGHFMPYATGGLAVGDVATHGQSNSGTVTSDQTTTKLGWDAGAGVEAAIAKQWSVKAEYLYVNLANLEGNNIAGAPTSTMFNENVFRVGLNYKFF